VLQKALANLKKGIDETLAVVESQHLPSVAVLEIHLLQLFQNLIGNAIKYRADEPPRIAISAKKDQAGVLFSIKDNGIGIEPQYKEHVFGLFKRLHTTEEYAGTGVGLAICQKIVERYGGRIWVESDLGRGSTFFFSLPTE
jgi:chemotaxis family two-component system sensor kinase Cph1